MSELISGKEALIAIANGEEVQFCDNMGVWHNAAIHTHAIGLFLNDCYEFRLKPRTITLNGIEVPAPFEPEDGDAVFALDNANPDGFASFVFNSNFFTINFGAWRTEEDVAQVVAALRSVFKGEAK